MKIIRSFVLTALIAVSINACSKPQGSESSLLLKLPASTAGYIFWDSTASSYTGFRASPWGRPSPISDSFKLAESAGLNTTESHIDLGALIATIEKTGLIATAPEQQDLIEQAVVFIDTPPIELAEGKQVQVAAYLKAKADVEMPKKFAQIRAELERQSLKTTDLTIGSLGGFFIEFPNANQLAGSERMIFAANADSGAIASSERLITQLLTNQTKSTLEISQSPHYTKTMRQLASQPAFFSGYLDTRKVMLALGNSLPESARGSLDAEHFPITALAYSRSFDQSVSDSIVLTLAEESDTQKSWSGALSALSNDKEILSALPKGVLGIISVDGSLLKNLRETILASYDKEQAQSITLRLEPFDSVKRIAVAVRNSSTAASPFPEVLIVAQSSNSESFLNSFVKESGTALSGAGLPVSGWQEKTIAGVKANYLVTPIGIGIYAASSGGFAVFASSERALSDALSAAKSAELQLAATISKGGAEILLNKATMLSSYVDFSQLAATIESVKGSLAMFTGSSPALDQIEVEKMSKLGKIYYSARYDDSLITISGRLEASE